MNVDYNKNNNSHRNSAILTSNNKVNNKNYDNSLKVYSNKDPVQESVKTDLLPSGREDCLRRPSPSSLTASGSGVRGLSSGLAYLASRCFRQLGQSSLQTGFCSRRSICYCWFHGNLQTRLHPRGCCQEPTAGWDPQTKRMWCTAAVADLLLGLWLVRNE